MPHLVALYKAQLEAQADLGGLCRRLADTMRACRDEAGAPAFPIGGIRVLAYPAAHYAVADNAADHGFVYLNLRIGRGRSAQPASGPATRWRPLPASTCTAAAAAARGRHAADRRRPRSLRCDVREPARPLRARRLTDVSPPPFPT